MDIIAMDSESIPFLFRLPKACFTAFISDWLTIQEMVHLDTAITSHKHRGHFLACLRHSNPEKHWKVNNLSLQWLSLRQISIYSIEFHCDVTKVQAISNLALPFLVSLEVYFLKNEGNIDQAVYYLIRSSPEIQSLKLETNSEITDAGVLHISYGCPLLKDFYLCPWDTCNVTITALMHLFRHCTLLENVALTQSVMDDNYSGTDLQQLREFGHLFHALTLFNEPFKSEFSSAQMIVDLLVHCPKVIELGYTSAHADDDSTLLNRLGEICPLLEMFHFNKVGGGEDDDEDDEQGGEGIIPISTYVHAFRRCARLKEINLFGDVMRHFTDADFKCLEEFGPLMGTLILERQRRDNQLTSQGFASFLRHCTKLDSIVCHGIDAEDAVLLERLGECPTCSAVSLTSLSNVTEPSLLALLHGCPKLSTLTLSCKSTLNVTDAFFVCHPFSPLLKRIDLNVTGVMWNETVVATCFAHCHKLEVVKVVWCLAEYDGKSNGLLDTGLAVLASGCPKLQEIELYFSPLLTLNGVTLLCETCPHLTDVTIKEIKYGNQPSVSDNLYPYEQIKPIRQRFPNVHLLVSMQHDATVGVLPEDMEDEVVG